MEISEFVRSDNRLDELVQNGYDLDDEILSGDKHGKLLLWIDMVHSFLFELQEVRNEEERNEMWRTK